jgi:hypothetical protein
VAQHRNRLLQYADDPRGIRRSAQDDREFVATKPADQADIVESPPQPLRDLAQACVPGQMAECIVELLEPVEVDQNLARPERDHEEPCGGACSADASRIRIRFGANCPPPAAEALVVMLWGKDGKSADSRTG